MSERMFIQDQRATENILSNNRQSELENQYIAEFRDGKRVDAIKIIKDSNTGPQGPQASRLACLIFEVDISSLYLNRLLAFDYSLIIMNKISYDEAFQLSQQIYLDYLTYKEAKAMYYTLIKHGF